MAIAQGLRPPLILEEEETTSEERKVSLDEERTSFLSGININNNNNNNSNDNGKGAGGAGESPYLPMPVRLGRLLERMWDEVPQNRPDIDEVSQIILELKRRSVKKYME